MIRDFVERKKTITKQKEKKKKVKTSFSLARNEIGKESEEEDSILDYFDKENKLEEEELNKERRLLTREYRRKLKNK